MVILIRDMATLVVYFLTIVKNLNVGDFLSSQGDPQTSTGNGNDVNFAVVSTLSPDFESKFHQLALMMSSSGSLTDASVASLC